MPFFSFTLHPCGAAAGAGAGSQEFRDAVGFCPAGLDAVATAVAFERLEKGEGIVAGD